MEETTKSETVEAPEHVPELHMKRGNKTFIIRLHFNEKSQKTLEDRAKSLIRKSVEEGNF